MVPLKLVGKLADMEEVQILQSTKIWNKPVEEITPSQLFATVTKLRNLFPSQKAEIKTAVDLMIAEVQKEYILGSVTAAPLLKFSWPTPPTPVRNIMRLLGRFDDVERRAILLALVTRRHIREVIAWTRADKPRAESEYQSLLYKKCLPRLGCKYLLWKDDGFQAKPLDGLESKFMATAKMSWGHFAELCQRVAATDQGEVEKLQALGA